MTNIKIKDFNRQCKELAIYIRDSAIFQAEEKHCSPYDVELDREEIRDNFRDLTTETKLAISGNETVERYFRVLNTNSIIEDFNGKTIKLFRAKANKEHHFGEFWLRFPEDKPL